MNDTYKIGDIVSIRKDALEYHQYKRNHEIVDVVSESMCMDFASKSGKIDCAGPYHYRVFGYYWSPDYFDSQALQDSFCCKSLI